MFSAMYTASSKKEDGSVHHTYEMRICGSLGRCGSIESSAVCQTDLNSKNFSLGVPGKKTLR